jgi:hypothetical protein
MPARLYATTAVLLAAWVAATWLAVRP